MPTPAPMDPRNGDLSGNAALHKMLGANKSTAIAPSAQETELDKKTSAKSDQSAQPVNITDSSNNRTDQRLPTSADTPDTPHTSPKPSGISTKLTRDHTKE